MSTPHSKAAKKFLENQKYATWHDATFWSVRTKRDNMALGLDEWEQLREKASLVKKHTISHLDEYLDKFANNAEKNGCIVHWAKDATEFNNIKLAKNVANLFLIVILYNILRLIQTTDWKFQINELV